MNSENYIKLLECIAKHSSKISNNAFLLATQIARFWYEQNYPTDIEVGYCEAVAMGYSGTQKTFIKSFKELTQSNIFTEIKGNTRKLNKVNVNFDYCKNYNSTVNITPINTIIRENLQQSGKIYNNHSELLTGINVNNTVINGLLTLLLTLLRDYCIIYSNPNLQDFLLHILKSYPLLNSQYIQPVYPVSLSSYPNIQEEAKIQEIHAKEKKISHNHTENQTVTSQKIEKSEIPINLLFENENLTVENKEKKQDVFLRGGGENLNVFNTPTNGANEIVDTIYQNENKTQHTPQKSAKKASEPKEPKPKKEPAPAKQQNPVYKAFVDIWFTWVKLNTGGANPNFTSGHGKAIQSIINQLVGKVETTFDQQIQMGKIDIAGTDFQCLLRDDCTEKANTHKYFIDNFAQTPLTEWQKAFLVDLKARETAKLFAKVLSNMCKIKGFYGAGRTDIYLLSRNLSEILTILRDIQNGKSQQNTTSNKRNELDPEKLTAELAEASRRNREWHENRGT